MPEHAGDTPYGRYAIGEKVDVCVGKGFCYDCVVTSAPRIVRGELVYDVELPNGRKRTAKEIHIRHVRRAARLWPKEAP